jgi:mono/diheme cytochrome c family protein
MYWTRIFFGAGAMALALVFMSQTGRPSIARGKEVYLQQCLACHQADGAGVEGTNPSLVKTKYVVGGKATLVRIILKGMQGVDIDGERYRNVMAPHADLTDQQIADVLTYVRNSFGNKASAVTAAEVKVIRGKTK